MNTRKWIVGNRESQNECYFHIRYKIEWIWTRTIIRVGEPAISR